MNETAHDSNGSTPRWILSLLVISLVAGFVPRPIRAGGAEGIERVIVLGFDGADPHHLQEWMDEGYLPHMKKLSETGVFYPLHTTNPPQSPVAWSSFATGTWPGNHGIYDFLKRDPKTYLPDVSYLSIEKPTFHFFDLLVDTPARAINRRHGPSFWKIASDQQKKVVVLSVPYSFPPDTVRGGKLLSGLGVPDLRGTNSTFYYYATDLTPAEASRGAGGSKFVRVTRKGNRIDTGVEGPVNPLSDSFERLVVPLSFTVAPEPRRVTIEMQGQSQTVAEGTWSDWFEIEYPVTYFYKMKGICRFYVIQADPEVQVYLSPLSMHPDAPYIPFSWPPSFSKELHEKYGFFKTVGWIHDTSALNAEKISEGQFLDEMSQIMAKRREMTLGTLKDEDFDLFISVFTATDRVSHMFYRLIDPKHPRYDAALANDYGTAIRDTYRKMDEIVGQVADRFVDEHTLLMIVSDHGFHSYRRGLNVNTWLVRNGYMMLEGQVEGQEVPDRLFSSREFFPNVDWHRTRAYAIGTGQVFINLKGREGKGIVSPGEEYNALVDEIRAGLLAVTDPKTGEKAFSNVYRRDDIFHGVSIDRAPDLQLAFAEGYCTSWETRLGGIPKELFLPNLKKWSGEHAASDVVETSGIFFSSRKTALEDPAIVDIATTTLELLGAGKGPEMEGRNLFDLH